MSYHRILSLEIKNKVNKKYKINLIIFIICLFFINNSYSKIFDKPISFYYEARNNAERSLKIVNSPIFLDKSIYWTNQIWIERNCVMYNVDYGNLSTCITGNITDQNDKDFQNNEKYFNKQPIIIGNWIYYPMVGQYLRFVALTQIKNNSWKDKMLVGFYQIESKEIRKYKQLDLNEESLKRLKEYGGGENSGNLALILWNAYVGNNCEKVWGENRIACYNELDIHDYDRFYFTGNEMTKYDLKYTIKEQVFNDNGIGVKEPAVYGHKETYRNKMYEQTFNVKTIWKGKLKDNETLTDLFKNMINNSKSNKILIIVPKDQRKLFMKIIKNIPNNYFKDKVGYVWFLSDSKHYNNIDKPKYNTKYDTKPNDKYDAELSRISNGKLKAKYGRYLTKERYSEDYVAPSIYGNNYNDEPEW